ncbi:glycosyltransferase [Xylanimonas protaetiae]|uniref:Glycosyltransferase n=1 Tax=Xylanimonas protaetiae TaxID=2509457 RepID=A0A4P6EZX9_9MICO|nr:glycosyltransferase [Xylanimonas protaetiae]QAY69030.1 glycosyltransferase [Xylanimonas protaetiae]
MSAVRDVVLASLESWDDVWRRNQHLVTGLLRRDPATRVLFVEPPVDLAHDVVRRATLRPGQGLRPGPGIAGVEPGRLWLYEPTKLLPRRVDPGGDRRRARATARAARRAGLTDPVLWINDPRVAGLLDVTPWPAVYDITDDWVVADRPAAERDRLVRGEMLLLERAAAVTVCSPALLARKEANGPVTLVTNGVDVERYRRPAARPADLPSGPVVLYVGTLHRDRLDVDLCVRVQASLGTSARLVFVGPVALGADDAARLRSAGAVLLGARPFTAVPAYLRHADVLVVPHVVDAFTDSLDPLKLYEYRAARRPVVATPVAGFRDSADSLVRAVPADAFAAAVRSALDGAGRDQGATLPETVTDLPTWDRQAGLFAEVLGEVSLAPRPATRP